MDQRESGVNREHQDSLAGQVHRENQVLTGWLESRVSQAAMEARVSSDRLVLQVAGARQDRVVLAETTDQRDCLEMVE